MPIEFQVNDTNLAEIEGGEVTVLQWSRVCNAT